MRFLMKQKGGKDSPDEKSPQSPADKDSSLIEDLQLSKGTTDTSVIC